MYSNQTLVILEIVDSCTEIKFFKHTNHRLRDPRMKDCWIKVKIDHPESTKLKVVIHPLYRFLKQIDHII